MSETKSDLENIENVILEYLERDIVKDALLLKGDWGSGKTSFLTNRIFDLIRDKLSNSKIIYLSLFGIRSLDKLKSSLVIELLPDKKYKSFLKSGGYSIAIKLIAAKLNIDIANILSSISFSKYLNNDKEYVFVFDDLERLNENLNYDTFLGWINNFIEHNSIKTILIAHESKIEKESYYEYKEKVVGTTV